MTTLHPADKQGLDAVMRVRPLWQRTRKLADSVIIPESSLLHAGPPFETPQQVTRPIMNSACVAAVFEGLADDFDDAEKQILSGDITLRAAQDFNVVTPLAAVVSESMWVHEIVDWNNVSLRAFAPLNGGSGAAMRLGLCNQSVLDHIRWLNSECADALIDVLEEPIDLIDIAVVALEEGDDCHGRTPVGTRELISWMLPAIEKHTSTYKFLLESPSFFLNLWMAACKCMLTAAVNIEGCSVITAAGANGSETGIQIGGHPGYWYSASANPPRGDIGEHPMSRALGAIGDSAIVDICGFGAMAMNHSPAQREALGAYLPTNGLELPAELLVREHPAFSDLRLRTGLCARVACEQNSAPIISLGILDKHGEAGRLGGGIFDMPTESFSKRAGFVEKITIHTTRHSSRAVIHSR